MALRQKDSSNDMDTIQNQTLVAALKKQTQPEPPPPPVVRDLGLALLQASSEVSLLVVVDKADPTTPIDGGCLVEIVKEPGQPSKLYLLQNLSKELQFNLDSEGRIIPSEEIY
ncbi:MAG: hypothetical protein NTZ48_05595 [Candidatus Omnitrophica bacterium]|nr:hypothetical protein [Candidatus Omnitrophota bacterium]